MNTAVATRDDQIAARIDKSVTAVMEVGETGITFNTANEVMEFAKMMATSGSAVPQHLRGQPGACLGIIDDAMRFKMSPYALARKSFFVNNNLAYEAQVIAALVIARAPVKQRPLIEYEGEGNARRCRVTAEFMDGAVRDYLSPAVGTITPKNSPLWKTDPDQQLAYFSTRAFARRHCPDVLLGVFDLDEMIEARMRDVTPKTSLASRLKPPAPASTGFSAEHVDTETGEIVDDRSEMERRVDETVDDAVAEQSAPPPPATIAGPELDELLDTGQARAEGGTEALKAWFAELSREERQAVRTTLDRKWKAVAANADRARETTP